ncbi:MAG: hypothetical protein L0Z62_13675 [Gemmataceae bacterium]|nr:hypothetical protein [Gemmataceae bacterium]
MYPSLRSPGLNRRTPSRCLALPVVAALTVLAAGCGGGQGNLSGKVALNKSGKTHSLAMGNVMVIGSDGKPYYSPIGEDGSYRVTGIPPGEAKIVVSSPDPKLVELGASRGKERDGGEERKSEPQPKSDRGKWIEIPKKYEGADTTDLKVTIRTGDNPFDITLESSGSGGGSVGRGGRR